MCQAVCTHKLATYFVIDLTLRSIALLCRLQASHCFGAVTLVASVQIYNANYTMDKVSQSVVGHLPFLMLSLPGSATSQPVCYTTNNVVGDIVKVIVEQEIMQFVQPVLQA